VGLECVDWGRCSVMLPRRGDESSLSSSSLVIGSERFSRGLGVIKIGGYCWLDCLRRIGNKIEGY
jgi:hypothetical protein